MAALTTSPAPFVASPQKALSPRAKWGSRAGVIIVLVAAVGIASAIMGRGAYLRYRANWGVVEPGRIYRSAEIPDSLVRQKLQDNHIGIIVFLSGDDPKDSDLQAEKKVAAEAGVQFLNFPMQGDGQAADPNQYVLALCAVHDAVQRNIPVLIHCHSGAQRTGGVVAMYRLLFQHRAPADAYTEMRHYGYDPRRNKALLPFLNQHIDDWAAALVARGVLDRVPDPMPHLTIP